MTPLDILLYVGGPPMLLLASYALWLVWEEEHPRSGPK